MEGGRACYVCRYTKLLHWYALALIIGPASSLTSCIVAKHNKSGGRGTGDNPRPSGCKIHNSQRVNGRKIDLAELNEQGVKVTYIICGIKEEGSLLLVGPDCVHGLVPSTLSTTAADNIRRLQSEETTKSTSYPTHVVQLFLDD